MKIKIRRCMVSDAQRIYELCTQELGYNFSYEQVESNVRRMIGQTNNLLLVAEQEDEEVLGFIHACNHDPVYAPPMKNIVALAVFEECRKLGIGRMLVEAAENWARETGASGMRVNSDMFMQKNALSFYKAMGYEYIRTQYNFRKML